MTRVVISGLRRALASVVLLGAVLASIRLALHRERVPVRYFNYSTMGAYATPRPLWTIPVAVALGFLGIVLAVLIYRPRAH